MARRRGNDFHLSWRGGNAQSAAEDGLRPAGAAARVSLPAAIARDRVFAKQKYGITIQLERGGRVMKKSLVIGIVVAGILAFTGPFASADEYSKNLPKVSKALAGATVPLDQGIKAAEAQGKPISAQYEIDEGHFQLSVFTTKGDDTSEIIVDYKTGAIKTVQNISDPDDIKDAKSSGRQWTRRRCRSTRPRPTQRRRKR